MEYAAKVDPKIMKVLTMNEAEKIKAAEEAAEKKAKGPSPSHPRPRTGKTRIDRERHAAAKNSQNKELRADWQNDRKADGSNPTSFPASACNGKRNRYQITGKGNETVYVKEKKGGK